MSQVSASACPTEMKTGSVEEGRSPRPDFSPYDMFFIACYQTWKESNPTDGLTLDHLRQSCRERWERLNMWEQYHFEWMAKYDRWKYKLEQDKVNGEKKGSCSVKRENSKDDDERVSMMVINKRVRLNETHKDEEEEEVDMKANYDADDEFSEMEEYYEEETDDEWESDEHENGIVNEKGGVKAKGNGDDANKEVSTKDSSKSENSKANCKVEARVVDGSHILPKKRKIFRDVEVGNGVSHLNLNKDPNIMNKNGNPGMDKVVDPNKNNDEYRPRYQEVKVSEMQPQADSLQMMKELKSGEYVKLGNVNVTGMQNWRHMEDLNNVDIADEFKRGKGFDKVEILENENDLNKEPTSGARREGQGGVKSVLETSNLEDASLQSYYQPVACPRYEEILPVAAYMRQTEELYAQKFMNENQRIGKAYYLTDNASMEKHKLRVDVKGECLESPESYYVERTVFKGSCNQEGKKELENCLERIGNDAEVIKPSVTFDAGEMNPGIIVGSTDQRKVVSESGIGGVIQGDCPQKRTGVDEVAGRYGESESESEGESLAEEDKPLLEGDTEYDDTEDEFEDQDGCDSGMAMEYEVITID